MVEGTRAAESVELAGSAEIGRADGVGVGVGGSEESAADGGLHHDVDVLEDVALRENVTARADLEGVPGVVVPVVVDLDYSLVGGGRLKGREGRTACRRVLPWTLGERPDVW